MDLRIQPVTETILLDFEIISNLKVQPEALTQAKETRQAKSGVSTDRPLSMNDLVDTTSRHPDILGEPILAQAHWSQKFLEQDLSGMYRWKLLAHCLCL